MAHRELFVRDLKQWLMPLDEGQVRPAAADAISSEALNSLRCILVEIEEASVFVAITASIAGALAEGRSNLLTAQHLMGYMPASPEIYRRHIDTVLAAALSPSIILPLQAYHARLSYALRLTRAIVDAGPAPSSSIRASEFEKLEDAWRHVCGTALAAISTIRDTLASVRYTRPPVNNEHAEALLRSAKAGGRPCVSEEGVRMPRWAESRTHTRHVTQTGARAFLPGSTQSVLIENASRTGLGLNGLEGAVVGTRLAIELPDGEQLVGKLMWVRGDRAGVQLEAMLPAAHTLLAGNRKD